MHSCYQRDSSIVCQFKYSTLSASSNFLGCLELPRLVTVLKPYPAIGHLPTEFPELVSEVPPGLETLVGCFLLCITGALVLIITIPVVAMQRNSSSFAFTSFNNPELGLPSKPYVYLVGLIPSQFTTSGFDASAHLVSSSSHLLDALVSFS